MEEKPKIYVEQIIFLELVSRYTKLEQRVLKMEKRLAIVDSMAQQAHTQTMIIGSK